MRDYSFETIASKGRLTRFGYLFSPPKKDLLDQQDRRALMVNFSLTEATTDTEIDADYASLSTKDKDIFRLFLRNNISKIRWYELKLIKENSLRILYAWITVLFVFGVPVFIGYMTFFADSFSYRGAELIGTTLTVLLSAIIGVHKVISSWIEKRRYRSHFFQAKVDLQNILFELDEVFDFLTNTEEAETVDAPKTRRTRPSLNAEMHEELFQAIKKSRKIVEEETRVFFEMSSTTTFELGSLLSQSGETARSVVSSFKSHSFDLDKKKEAETKTAEAKRKAAEKSLNTEITLKASAIKLDRLANREMVLLEKLHALEQLPELTDVQYSEKRQLETDLNSVQREIEALELECLELRLREEHAVED